MRNLVFVFLMVVIGAILHQFLPWWSIWCAGLLTGLFLSADGAIRALAVGILGGALLWGGYALWLNLQNDGLMASRIGELFGGLGVTSLLLLTALFGGLFGGLGTLCAYLGKLLFQRSLAADSLK